MKKLNVRTYRLHRLADYIGVIFLIALLMFIWQLYRGPIAIPFLKPYIIKALNHDDAQYQVTLDSVNLELVRSIKPLRIIANNVVYRKNNDEIIINAPKTSVSFSIKALMRGVIAPSNIEVENPSVYIFTTYGISQENKKEANQKKLEYYFENDCENHHVPRFLLPYIFQLISQHLQKSSFLTILNYKLFLFY